MYALQWRWQHAAVQWRYSGSSSVWRAGRLLEVDRTAVVEEHFPVHYGGTHISSALVEMDMLVEVDIFRMPTRGCQNVFEFVI